MNNENDKDKPEEFMLEIPYYASLIAFYKITGHQADFDIKAIQDTFNKLVDMGVYRDTFIEVLYPTSQYSQDFIDPLQRALESLDIEIPNNIRATLDGILMYHLSKIIDGTSEPYKSMMAISDELELFNFRHSYNIDFSQMSQSTQKIIRLASDCTAHYDNPYTEPSEQDILQIAKLWLAEHTSK